MLARLAGS